MASLPWVGVARALSPDAPFRHPAFRSLDGNLAPQSLLRSVSNAASIGTGNPSRVPLLRKANDRLLMRSPESVGGTRRSR